MCAPVRVHRGARSEPQSSETVVSSGSPSSSCALLRSSGHRQQQGRRQIASSREVNGSALNSMISPAMIWLARVPRARSTVSASAGGGSSHVARHVGRRRNDDRGDHRPASFARRSRRPKMRRGAYATLVSWRTGGPPWCHSGCYAKGAVMIRRVMLLLAVLMLTLGGPAWAVDLVGTLKKITDTGRCGSGTGRRPPVLVHRTTTASRPATRWTCAMRVAASHRASSSGCRPADVLGPRDRRQPLMELASRRRSMSSAGRPPASRSRQAQVDFSSLTFVDGGSLVTDRRQRKHGRRSRRQARRRHSRHHHRDDARRGAPEERGQHREGGARARSRRGRRRGRGRARRGVRLDRIVLVGIRRPSKSADKLRVIDEFFSYEPYALMLRRDDSAFRLAVNRALARLYRSGDVVPLVGKWFGSMGRPVGCSARCI